MEEFSADKIDPNNEDQNQGGLPMSKIIIKNDDKVMIMEEHSFSEYEDSFSNRSQSSESSNNADSFDKVAHYETSRFSYRFTQHFPENEDFNEEDNLFSSNSCKFMNEYSQEAYISL